MSGVSDFIYRNSPVWLQNVGISLYGLNWRRRRYGGKFRQYVEQFVQHESYSRTDWHHYQTRKLRELLTYAGKYVPYYENLFFKIGLTLPDLQNFEIHDLSKLPLLEKETIRQNPDLFVSRKPMGHLNTHYTSGTTGTPLAIKWSTETERLNAAAYEARVRRWAGVNHYMSRAMIGGRLVVPGGNAQPPFWRYNVVERQLYMSAFHISPANAPDYVNALNRFQPDYLVGYASSHFFLARMIDELKLSVYQPKAVLTSSEKLTSEMRALLEKVYRCPVFDAYNGVEGSCLVSECGCHQLHISPDVGIVELLDKDGGQVVPGQMGEIVTTGFLNFEQPLIRYRMGDAASFSSSVCSCNREMPLINELIGRLEDVVIGPDGRELVRFHGIFIGLPHVSEGQIVQHGFTKFDVNLVVDAGFSEKERQIIRRRFEERLGPVELKFVFVDQIERTERGKFRAVISKVRR
ncbi:MAG: phenylacetate--CoA ligase family protein [Anaerolineales bacterium]|nr:phenylacetate--CoA ligase family protein [Anaerolineales bacterium]